MAYTFKIDLELLRFITPDEVHILASFNMMFCTIQSDASDVRYTSCLMQGVFHFHTFLSDVKGFSAISCLMLRIFCTRCTAISYLMSGVLFSTSCLGRCVLNFHVQY